MAYRFDGSTSYVKFNPAPLTGYTIGPVTFAGIYKRTSVTDADVVIGLIDAGLAAWRFQLLGSLSIVAATTVGTTGSGFAGPPTAVAGTWYLGVMTWGGGAGTKARSHYFDGTSWTHGDGPNNLTGGGAGVSTDLLTVGGPTFGGAQCLQGDIACAGIKKANLADLAVEALTFTFTTWTAFSFDWLVKFDNIATRPDVGAAGTGTETSRVNVSLVTDPPGFTAAAATGSFFPFM